VRPAGQTALGTKTELKNLNSIKGVEKGLTAEIARQTKVVEGGGRIEQATLLYDADHDKLAIMRTKEHAHDYRYFPEPDLPVLRVDATWLDDARTRLTELPWRRAERLVSQYGLPDYDAGILCDQRELADYFESAASGADGKLASNWIMTEVLRVLKERGWTVSEWSGRVPAERLVDLLGRVARRELPGPLAKQVFGWMTDESGTVDELLARHEVKVQSSNADLAPLVRAVIEENPGPVAQYRGGKTATLGFLVGQVMKKSGGQAVPQTVRELLEAELAG
jgi:aspartyl-tRNA(Asn)/glutamyl-tRNA(Gln) amidotransferase subunit B